MKSFVICINVLLLSISIFSNDLVLSFTSKDLADKKAAPTTGEMFISGKKIAMKMLQSEQKAYTIFRGDKELILAVDDIKKECTEIDKATMDKMGQTMQKAMKQMEAQLAQMPPEQRAMMEGMMNQQMLALGQASKASYSVVKVGKTAKIGPYNCELYEVMLNNKKVRALWVTKWNNLKHSKKLLEAFVMMSDFLKDLFATFQNSPMYNSFDNPYTHSKEIDGFPVKVIEYEEGLARLETTFNKVQQKKLAPTLFEAPKGYAVNKPEIPVE